MRISRTKFRRRATWLWRLGVCLLVAVLTVGHAAPTSADSAPPAGAGRTDGAVVAFAMRWYAEMQAGRMDRSQYAAAYGAQLTDDAVRGMSRALNRYGASPLRAEIVQTRTGGEQTFYLVKYIFPRGDATSLMFGFDAAGKITGVGVESLAGD